MLVLFPGALIRPEARDNLGEIVVYLGEKDVARAKRFAEAFLETARMLVSFPNMGSPRPIEEINIRELRVFPINGFKTYLIWYHPLATHDGIEIVRVLHHSRDAPTHLAGESADS